MRFSGRNTLFAGKPKLCLNIEYANKLVRDALLNDNPVMITSIGTTECGTLLNYLGIKEGKKNPWKYITWRQQAWWWNGTAKKTLPTVLVFSTNRFKAGAFL